MMMAVRITRRHDVNVTLMLIYFSCVLSFTLVFFAEPKQNRKPGSVATERKGKSCELIWLCIVLDFIGTQTLLRGGLQVVVIHKIALHFNTQHLSYGGCLEAKRELLHALLCKTVLRSDTHRDVSQSNSSMHHYERTVLCKDSLQRGQISRLIYPKIQQRRVIMKVFHSSCSRPPLWSPPVFWRRFEDSLASICILIHLCKMPRESEMTGLDDGWKWWLVGNALDVGISHKVFPVNVHGSSQAQLDLSTASICCISVLLIAQHSNP